MNTCHAHIVSLPACVFSMGREHAKHCRTHAKRCCLHSAPISSQLSCECCHCSVPKQSILLMRSVARIVHACVRSMPTGSCYCWARGWKHCPSAVTSDTLKGTATTVLSTLCLLARSPLLAQRANMHANLSLVWLINIFCY